MRSDYAAFAKLPAAVTIDTSDGRVRINDATVRQADITTSNAVIQVIDTILLPPSIAAAPAAQQHAMSAELY